MRRTQRVPAEITKEIIAVGRLNVWKRILEFVENNVRWIVIDGFGIVHRSF